MDVTAQILQCAKNNNLMGSTELGDKAVIVEKARQAFKSLQGQEYLLLELENSTSNLPYEASLLREFEELAFTHEISVVMALHSVLSSDPKDQAARDRAIKDAALVYECKKVLHWPHPLSKALSYLCSLAMYARIAHLEQDFDTYLTAFLPYLAKLKCDLVVLKGASQDITLSKDNASTVTNARDSNSSIDKLLLHRQELKEYQESLLLELCSLLGAIMSLDSSTLLSSLEDFKASLLTNSKQVATKHDAYYLLYLSKLAAAIKASALNERAGIEHHVNVAIDLCSKIGLSDLELIARAFKVILLMPR